MSKPKLQLRPRPGASRPDAGPCHSTISKDCTAGEGARRAEMLASLDRRLCVGQRAGTSPQQSEKVLARDGKFSAGIRGPRAMVDAPSSGPEDSTSITRRPERLGSIEDPGSAHSALEQNMFDDFFFKKTPSRPGKRNQHGNLSNCVSKADGPQEILAYPPTPRGRPVNDSASQKQLPRPSRGVKPHKVAVKERRWDKLGFRKHEPARKRAAPP
ncbi:hypothetical protein CSOJ01_15827 [Colletotrichum sojae]|uniref:Uncharacterized protein n=1 Tax=Colletotrichum sojae TaxID=2175907 RepID=A0A8H6ILF9_9PEZI|nr:hypothetical protein CSOJ01_15827 [Colletotrichum sojae]